MSIWPTAGALGVCITANWWNRETHQKASAGPRLNERVVIVETEHRPDGALLVRVKGHAGMFNVRGFRPVKRVSRRQDVAQFRHLLTPTANVEDLV